MKKEQIQRSSITDWNNKNLTNMYIDFSLFPASYFERTLNTYDLISSIPDDVESVLDFGCGSMNFLKELRKSGRFKRMVGVDLPAVVEVLKERLPEEFEGADIRVWDGKSENKEIKGFDLAVLKLVTPFLSDKDLNIVLSNISKSLNSSACILFSLPHPLNLQKRHGIDTAKKAHYDEIIKNTNAPHIKPIPIKVVYRPKEEYEKILAQYGFSLEKVSEPKISDDELKKHNLPEGYNEYPYRLNLLFKR